MLTASAEGNNVVVGSSILLKFYFDHENEQLLNQPFNRQPQ
jgi:hypothetical protein